MIRLSSPSVLFTYFLFISAALGRERDVWSIGNVELKPETKPSPEIKFSFTRKLSPECLKSKISSSGCTAPVEDRLSTRTCSGPVDKSGEWQICSGSKNGQASRGSTRWRLKRNTYKYSEKANTKLTIEMVRKEEIHEYIQSFRSYRETF
jgi:hypothetical protein